MTGMLQIDHEYLYMIETNNGTHFIFETDYLDSIEYISSLLKERTEHFTEFAEVKNPLEEYKVQTLKKYATKEIGSSRNYFLLIKRSLSLSILI